jgi:hypothetical protein
MNFWNGLPTRQKILAVVFILTCVLAGISLYSSSDEPAGTGTTSNSNGSLQPKAPISPTTAKSPQPQAFAVLRDPFSVPQGYRTAAPTQQQAQQFLSPSSSSSANAAPAPNFATLGTFNGANTAAAAGPAMNLTGVVGAGSSKAIIIRSGSGSRSYRMHDQVGPYEIVDIGDRSVTLEGTTGQKVLFLGE